MPPTEVVGFQLKTLAELLQKVYSAVDLSQIARAIRFHVRDNLPVDSRVPGQLDTIERRVVMALEDLYLASLHPEGPPEEMDPSLSERISTAESYYQSQIEAAARTIDRAGLVTSDASILRAAAPAIAEAAQDIVRRRSNEFALDIARDQESLGAPPSILFQLDGRIIWANHALTEMCEQRTLTRNKLLQAACRFAAPLCAALRRRDEPKSRNELRKRFAEMGVHFRATVKRRNDSAGEALLLVEISEAKRATELSPRELQVARLVSEHGSYKTAAEVAQVSLDSVRTYIRRIYRKFGVSNRMQLKARLIREGLMPAGK
ncbi:MAG: helix-turn-helix transcriptional regulator [Planctomycetes bacterium]|nr:helix-turn-helix transcriptional regulator [Planctomycetota bacterium]